MSKHEYSCLENLMDGGAWWAAVHGVAKSRTRLSDLTSQRPDMGAYVCVYLVHIVFSFNSFISFSVLFISTVFCYFDGRSVVIYIIFYMLCCFPQGEGVDCVKCTTEKCPRYKGYFQGLTKI